MEHHQKYFFDHSLFVIHTQICCLVQDIKLDIKPRYFLEHVVQDIEGRYKTRYILVQDIKCNPDTKARYFEPDIFNPDTKS